MYLRAGIGAFCVVTLLQCCVEVAEGIENFTQNRFNCYFETYVAISSGLQFIFGCLQFLFIFLRGNVSEIWTGNSSKTSIRYFLDKGCKSFENNTKTKKYFINLRLSFVRITP
jgi:hypothetical protein